MKKLVVWGMLLGGVYGGYQMYHKGYFRGGLKGTLPKVAWNLRNLPIVGRSLRQYANSYYRYKAPSVGKRSSKKMWKKKKARRSRSRRR